MDRYNKSNGVDGAPVAPPAADHPYFTSGDPQNDIPATTPGPWWFHMITESLRNVILAAGMVPSHNTLTLVRDAILALILAGSATQKYMLIRDEKAQGTDGGTSVAGDQTRVLNTVVSNTIPGATLSANQVTLPAGNYRISASAPTRDLDRHRAYIYNVTDAAVLCRGTSEDGTTLATSKSFIEGRFTLAATKVLELRHYTQAAIATTGLGFAVSAGGVEVFSQVVIIKEA